MQKSMTSIATFFRNRMSHLMLCGVILAPCDVSHAQVETESASRTVKTASTLPRGYQQGGKDESETLRILCQKTAKTDLFSGSILVAKDGRILFEQGFGFANREWKVPNTPDTRFRLASVSKQFCSMLVMQLIQENKLSLGDVICDHLGYYREDTGTKITIHHLLSHQSGLKDFTASFDYRGSISKAKFGKDEFIQLHCSSDLTHEPGTIYSYCNAGYCILGRIIEKVTGLTYEKNLQDRIFKPLGMSNSGFERSEKIIERFASGYQRGPFSVDRADFIEMDNTPGAAGAIYSTVRDMYLWDRALHTEELLSKSNRELMFTPNQNVPEVEAAGGRARSVYGYGWQITNRVHPVTNYRVKVISHGGAINGFRAMESRLVDEDAFIIILCNLGDQYGSGDVWNSVVQLNNAIIDVVTGQPYRPPAGATVTQDHRLYRLVRDKGADAAIEWFNRAGKKAAWGGSLMAVSNRLLEEGQTQAALTLIERDIEMSPRKTWLLRQAAQAFLDAGQANRAIKYAEMGLSLKPKDERLQSILSEAKKKAEVR